MVPTDPHLPPAVLLEMTSPRAKIVAANLDESGDQVVLAFEGDACLATVQLATPLLGRWYRRLPHREVLADLSGLSFIDGRGLTLLLTLQRMGDQVGVPLRFSNERMSGCVERLLDICGLEVRREALVPRDPQADPAREIAFRSGPCRAAAH